MPVLVLANIEPDTSALSLDRWEIIRLDHLVSKVPSVNPALYYAPVIPPTPPDLSADFDFRNYLEQKGKMGMYNILIISI